MSAIATSGKGEMVPRVSIVFRYAPQPLQSFEPPIVARRVRRGGDERLARFVAIDARVDRPLPRGRAERAAQEPMAADHFGERRPRAAGRAVAMVPGAERFGERQADCQPEGAGGNIASRSLQRMGNRPDGQLGNQPGEIRRQAQVCRAGSDRLLIARERGRQQRARVEPAAVDRRRRCGWPPRRRRRPPGRRRSRRAHDFSRRVGQRDRFSGQDRHAARQLGGQIFPGQRQAGQASSVDRARQIDDAGQEAALEVNGGLEVGLGRHKGLPAAFGRGEHLA